MAEIVRFPREVRLGVERTVADTVRRLRMRRGDAFDATIGFSTMTDGLRLFTGDDFLRLELLIAPLLF